MIGLDDQPVHPLAVNSAAAVRVFIFITTDCPIANGYAPEINRLVNRFSDRNVAFTLVHVDPGVSAVDARQHSREYGYTCQVVLDPTHALVKAIGATITPEAAVVDDQHRLVYLGRIDDLYVDLGKRRMDASQHDLCDAIEQVLNGKRVETPRTSAVGCFIPEPRS